MTVKENSKHKYHVALVPVITSTVELSLSVDCFLTEYIISTLFNSRANMALLQWYTNFFVASDFCVIWIITKTNKSNRHNKFLNKYIWQD